MYPRLPRFTAHPLSRAVHAAIFGTLLATAFVPPPARAATLEDRAVKAYSLPVGPLGRTLASFAAEAGIALSFDSALTDGKTSPALAGSYTVREALARLLAGSGLELAPRSDGSHTLRKAPEATRGEAVLPAVTVKAGADEMAYHLKARIGGGALGERSLLETPLSTTIVTGDDLAERQVSKLGDVFAMDASVTDNSGAYSSWASYVTVRGLELDWQNSYRIDGKPFMSYAITLPYEHFEQIELLKGASGFLYGFGSPGGLINYATKNPTDSSLRSVKVGVKSNSIWSESIDLGGRFGTDAMFGYRLNAVHEAGRTFNDGRIDRDSASLALDARLTPDLSWYFNSLYQKRRAEGQTPSISVTTLAGNGLPPAVDGDNQDLLSQGQFLDTEFKFHSTGVKYTLSTAWTASASYTRNTATRSRNESILYLRNAAGDYSENRSDTREGHRFDHWQVMLEGRAATGAFEHQAVFGAAWQKQLNDYTANGIWASLGNDTLFGRNGKAYYTQGNLNLYRAGDITQKAVFASDTVKLSERWSALAGLRHVRYAQNDYNPDGSRQGDYADSVSTPSLALMYRPAANTMVYASYMESLEPGRTVGSTYANANRMLDPLVSKQYEIGVKSEQSSWAGTAALFRIERPSEYADAANVLIQDGESSYQGLELGAVVRLGSRWQLEGNLMRLDSSYDKGNANLGKRVAGAPEWMATTRVTYKVPEVAGLKLMMDAKYTGDVMLNPGNTFKAGGHAIVNVGASYVLTLGGRVSTLRAAINNLGNERFWEYQYANWIKPADPRSVSISAQFDF